MKKNKILFLILLLAATFRLWGLSGGDILGDEVLYSFRAVGMLDFDNAAFQTTPLEWQDPNIQWWTKLSFHDHPPLVFLTQHIFMKIFGESPWAFRLPSAILGVISVYLLYLIGKRLFNQKIGLLAAAILAVTINHVFISRVGLQESYVIFFILLSSYFFLKALERPKNFLWLGMATGLGLLTKYTTGIVSMIFAAYLLLFRRLPRHGGGDFFRSKYLWLGVALAVLIASPVIIYNIQLYRAVGHFDFQISYIVGQQPEVWKIAPGKEEIGALTDRLKNFIPNLINSNSWPFLIIFMVSLYFIRRQKFLIMTLAGTTLLFLLIGPTTRFLTMLTPWMVLGVAALLDKVPKRWLIGSFLALEILYTTNSQILTYPIGSALLTTSGLSPWTYSKVRNETYHWGYAKLEKYLDRALMGRRPALTFDMKYQFLNKIKDQALEDAAKMKLEAHPAIVVYDGNILSAPAEWIFDRRQIYHGWPVMKASEYRVTLAQKGKDYFHQTGIRGIYFVMPTANVPLNKKNLTDDGAILEQEFLSKGFFPEAIYNDRGEEAFRVYKIDI